MNADDMLMENCRSSWRNEARARAIEEARAAGLDPNDSSDEVCEFIAARAGIHYTALEEIGLENIK